MVDVARALGVSHGSIYRHFSSKAALQDAIADRWLTRKLAPLAAIASEDGSATERLRRWFNFLCSTTRQKVLEDPEFFATYKELAGSARGVVKAHIDHLIEQITLIIRDGVAQGEFVADDPIASARAVFAATTFFHDPAHVAAWSDPDINAMFDGVWFLILHGLSPRNISQE